MHKMLSLAIGVFVVLPAGAAGADDAARAIVDRAIKAGGGEAKLAQFDTMTWKEKGVYYGMGDGVPYTASLAVQWPGKMRMEVEGVFIIVLDGDKGWLKAGNSDTTDLDKERMAEQKEEQYAGWAATLLPLKRKGFTLTSLGEAKVNDRPAVGVKVSHEGHRDVKLFFDKDTGLLTRSEQTVKPEDADGKEVKQDVLYKDYKDIAGAKFPMKIILHRDGKKFVEAEMEDIKPEKRLDDSVFSKP
jgi:hypothetical protein